MRWPRAVFERGRMIGRVSLKEAAPFLSCHVDDHAACGRPKACDPGAAARAMDGWMMLSPHKGGGKIRKSA